MKIAVSLAVGHAKGISPIIATVLMLLISITTLGITLGVVNPAINRAKDTSIVNDAFGVLDTLNSAVKEVAAETDGSKRVVPITVTGGTLRVNSTYDWLYIEYEPTEDLLIGGKKGNTYVERGLAFMDNFNHYAEGSRPLPAWTNMSGQCTVSSNSYSITNGTAYHNISETLENWKFSATITNISGSTGGQVFALPTNPESLVGFWPFDEYTGTNAYDYSGKNNTAALTDMNTTGNATSGWTRDCKYGGCLKFSGTTDYVVASPSISGLNTFTITGWIKPSVGDNTENHPFAASSASNFQTWVKDGNQFTWYHATLGSMTKTITYGAWTHVVLVVNSTGRYLYFDSVLQGNDAGTYVLNSATFYVGRNYSSLGYNFNGTIDEVMIFNRSLSADEIRALYETSTKKLAATGMQSIAAKTNPAIVLANPAGTTKFDDVKVSRDRKDIKLVVPCDNIDINGTLRAAKGEYKIQIRHVETNATLNKPTIEITAV
jgi:hypothetical protein